MSELTPLSAATFLGPRTEANAIQFDSIEDIFRGIRSLPPIRQSHPCPFIQNLHWKKYRELSNIVALVPGLEGWRVVNDTECEKLYEIGNCHYWAFAYLDGCFLTVELMLPDADGRQPCLPCLSLLDGARKLQGQIEILYPEGHGRVDGGRDHA